MASVAQRLVMYTFDEEYVRQLQERVRSVEDHFSAYCGRLLANYLSSRIKSPDLREDISQETLLRVLIVLRSGGLKRPECLGAFVVAVCQNVTREFLRAQVRYSPFGEQDWRADAAPNPETQAIGREMRSALATAVNHLPERDRQVLAIPLAEDRPQDVCRRLGLKHDHLRVVLH